MAETCRGRQKGGTKSCKCIQFVERKKDGKCMCRHGREQHASVGQSRPDQPSHVPSPAPPVSNSVNLSGTMTASKANPSSEVNSVQDVVAKYHTYFELDEDIKPGSTRKAEESSARAETNRGFRTKKTVKSELTMGEKPSKGKKKASIDSGPKMAKVGKVVMIAMGLDTKGRLVCEASPTAADQEELRKFGMAISRFNSSDLEFSKSWDILDIDNWMRRLFPKAFDWLDARWGRPEKGVLHWVLLQKTQRKLFILERPDMTGEDLYDARGVVSRGFRDHVIHITPRHPIAPEVYKNWERAISDPMSFGDSSVLGLESESDDNEPKAKPTKGKGKAKAATPSLSSGSEFTGDVLSSDSQTRRYNRQANVFFSDDDDDSKIRICRRLRKRCLSSKGEDERPKKILKSLEFHPSSPVPSDAAERWIETAESEMTYFAAPESSGQAGPSNSGPSYEAGQPTEPSNDFEAGSSSTLQVQQPSTQPPAQPRTPCTPRRGFTRVPPRNNPWL